MQHNNIPRPATAMLALAGLMFTAGASAGNYDYAGGRATTCTSTCDSFAALSPPPAASVLQGTIEIDVGPSDTFTAADITSFEFLVTSPVAPLEPYDGTNPATANPLPVSGSVAVIEASNTAGTVTTGGSTNAQGEIVDGTVLFRFTVAPFNNNDAWVIFDVGTGTAQVCLFFDTSGCIPMATESVVIEVQGFSDGDTEYTYNVGQASTCTGTCDSFASLSGDPTPSTLSGTLTIDVAPGASFTAADITDFNFKVGTSGAAFEMDDGTNPATANPLILTPSVAMVEASNTAGTVTTGGTTNAAGGITDGTVLIRFTVPPFNNNDAWVVFDVGSGTAQVCLFYDTSGCIPMATESVVFDVPAFSLDSDADGVVDRVDNCLEVANAPQNDSNGDGHGNRCDADLNGDCIVNPIDLGIFKTRFFTNDPDANFDGIGPVNVLDLGILKSLFFSVPGTSAAPNSCGNL